MKYFDDTVLQFLSSQVAILLDFLLVEYLFLVNCDLCFKKFLVEFGARMTCVSSRNFHSNCHETLEI